MMRSGRAIHADRCCIVEEDNFTTKKRTNILRANEQELDECVRKLCKEEEDFIEEGQDKVTSVNQPVKSAQEEQNENPPLIGSPPREDSWNV